ncbi:hypothetical protein D3C81_2075790 [compost metagenome]
MMKAEHWGKMRLLLEEYQSTLHARYYVVHHDGTLIPRSLDQIFDTEYIADVLLRFQSEEGINGHQSI